MKRLSLFATLMLPLLPLRAGDPPGTMSISVNEADLQDVLRAATADTDLNLIFEPGLETRVNGLNLKAMGLQGILDDVLPRLGLACTRDGRNLYIHARAEDLRFYHLDQLALARSGTKQFQVNASGQVLQGQGAGGAAANTSAFTSSLEMGHTNDPWADVEGGLMLIIFGKGVDRPAAPSGPAPAPASAAAPRAGSAGGDSRSYTAGGRSLLIQPNAGLVAVKADADTQAKVAAYLGELRRRTQRQVLLEARIVEVTLGAESQMGVDWRGLLSGVGNPAASSFVTGATLNSDVDASQGLLQIVAQNRRVQATLTALARDNRVKVLSAPRLATLNNQKAILRVVREEAYGLPSSQITPGTAAGGAVATGQVTPLIVPVGIILDIQPQIGDDGMITLAVNPSISEVAREKAFQVPGAGLGASLASASLPVVLRRDLDTVVRVRSGETLVLAGMIQSRENADNRGVPWVRKIPLLGALFSKEEKNRQRTELAIFITPTLMEDPVQVEAQRRGAEERLQGAGADVKPPLAREGASRLP